MRAIPAYRILADVFTGAKALGADFSPDVAGGAFSAPILVANPNGYTSCTFTQDVPLLVAGETRSIALNVSRKVCAIAIWVIKTGDAGGAADTLTVHLGSGAQPISSIIPLSALNGRVMLSTLVAPQYMEVDPFATDGFFRLEVTATAGLTDTRCIVYIKCLCSGPV